MGQIVQVRVENRGFTLMEMLVVLSIFIFLLGLGITVLSRLSYRWGFEANIMRVQTVIRSARNFSLTNESPSEVHVIPKENRIFALGEKTVAQWHFENVGEEVLGAFNIRGKVFNANIAAGKTGEALEFGTNEGLQVRDSYVDCGNLAAFTPPSGIVLEMWIYPGDFRSAFYKSLIGDIQENDMDEEDLEEEELEEQARRKAANEITRQQKFHNEKRFQIIFKEGSYFLTLTENYALEFGFAPVQSFFPMRTGDNVIVPNMWNHIVLRYIGTFDYAPDKVRLYVNDIPLRIFYIEDAGADYDFLPIDIMPERLAEEMLPRNLIASSSSLLISDYEESFFGIIDEVRIGAVIDPEIDKLDSAFLMGYPQVICFDSQGRLDPERHEGDITIKLTENPLYEPPDPEKEDEEYISRGGAVTGLISADEALDNLNENRAQPEKYKHAIISINRYGRLSLKQVEEEEPRED